MMKTAERSELILYQRNFEGKAGMRPHNNVRVRKKCEIL
jgi:hypothetical protein